MLKLQVGKAVKAHPSLKDLKKFHHTVVILLVSKLHAGKEVSAPE